MSQRTVGWECQAGTLTVLPRVGQGCPGGQRCNHFRFAGGEGVSQGLHMYTRGSKCTGPGVDGDRCAQTCLDLRDPTGPGREIGRTERGK